MSTDKLNLLFTILSIIVTFVSIVFSIWASLSAKKAKQYKEETLLLRNILDLESLHSKFQIESRNFQDKIRGSQWYKGVDVNTIISPYKDFLFSFGEIYHLIKSPEELKQKVHALNDIVYICDKVKRDEKAQINTLIIEILDILQQEIVRNTKNIK